MRHLGISDRDPRQDELVAVVNASIETTFERARRTGDLAQPMGDMFIVALFFGAKMQQEGKLDKMP